MFGFLFKKKTRNRVKEALEDLEEIKKEISESEDPSPAPENYDYKLTTCDRGTEKDSFDPNDYDIDSALKKLRIAEENFLVLSRRVPIANFTFVQATGYDRTERSVYVEAQVKKTSFYQHYCTHLDIEALGKILREFISGENPDISSWDEGMTFNL